MKRFGKGLLRGVLVLAGVALLLWAFGPYEDAQLDPRFDEAALADGVAPYFAAQEARFDDIIPGVQKRVIWHDAPETRTDWAVVYLHGFSATSQEIRPVPDDVAAALGANLILTRLTGHGRDGEAMTEGSVPAWMQDTAEALAAARAVGDRVLVIGTSTGATLAAAAAADAALSRDVAGMVLISPNFAINDPAAPLLTWPAARYWLPLLAGKQRSWEPHNEAQGQYWTTSYPSVAGLPVGALVGAVDALDLGTATVPALFIYSDADQVVVPAATDAAMAEWGGPVLRMTPALTPADDPSAHVIAGDILSPAQNAPVTAAIVDFAQGL